MKTAKKGFLFDLNGTMVDDMAYHLDVWYEVLTKDLGATMTRAETKVQMYGKNRELLDRVFGAGKFTDAEVEKISMQKEVRYQEIYKPHLRLIDGLPEFLEQARATGVKMAIGSAAIPFNIDFVVDNLNLRNYFQAVVSADDVAISKPDPEVFLKAAEKINVAPQDCVVFEDAPKGVEAALRAGMDCVVLTTVHGAEEFRQYPNVLWYVKDYTDPRLAALFAVSASV
jgi:HAD superfamily hydrolase (TIGR01509 family)